MRNTKKFAIAMTAAAMTLSMTMLASAEGHLFGYTCMDLTDPFHIVMRDALKEAVEANGDELIDIDGRANQQKQNEVIEDMVAQGIEILFLNPVDSASVEPELELCAEKGIPVINIDSAVQNRDLIATYISSDNVEAGRQCGEAIVELYPDGAKIALIDNPLAESVVDRVKGLTEAIEGTNCEIVDQLSYGTMDQVLNQVEDILTRNEDLDVLWGLNDEFGMIMLGAVESAGKADQIKVLAVDGSPSGKISVSEGGLYATAAQSPRSLSLQAAECAYTLLDGGEIEPEYTLPTTLVTQENCDEMVVDEWS